MSEPGESELLILAKRLYARRATAMVVPYKNLDATHVERLCHINADSWVRDTRPPLGTTMLFCCDAPCLRQLSDEVTIRPKRPIQERLGRFDVFRLG